MVRKALSFVMAFLIIGCAPSSIRENGIYSVIKTNYGNITCRLFYDKTPIAAGNFIGLASGTREYKDVNTGKMVKKPFYNGLIFHRVVHDFVIQGGCPYGKGYGDAGYKFVDEINGELKFDSAGMLAMANSGPNTNGSQFFITLSPAPELDGKYTIFGKVVSGLDCVRNIGNSKTDQDNRPYKEIFIREINIIRAGSDARKFDAEANFAKNTEALAKLEEEKKIKTKELLIQLGVDENKIIENKSGLKYFVVRPGYGKMPSPGDRAEVNYTLYLEDKTKVDSSIDRKEPFEFSAGTGQVIEGWDQAILSMKEGEKRVLIIPYYLAYGEAGFGEPGKQQIIPPKAALIFEVELIKIIKK